MLVENFLDLTSGDIVYAVINTGMAGISKYQYIGTFKCHLDNHYKHVFLSEFFVSTLVITKGRENTSRTLKKIFFNKSEALQYRDKLINEGKQF